MTDLINIAADDALGYPAYYRAVYQRGRIDPLGQLANVVGSVYARMQQSEIAVPVNAPAPLPGDRAAVLVLRISDGSVQSRTVADLVRELDVSPLWGFLPDVLSAVTLKSLESIDRDAAYSSDATDAERQRQNADAATNDPIATLGHTLQLLVVVIVAGGLLYLAAKAFKEFK